MNITQVNWGMILSGLAVFFFGIILMGESSKSLFSDRVRYYIDRFTNTPQQTIITSAISTALIQSSSAMILSITALVKAKVMELKKALRIVIGANVGTTITIFLIGLSMSKTAPFIMIFSALALLITKSKKKNDIAMALMGLGLLQVGLYIISGPLQDLNKVDVINNLFQIMQNRPYLSFLSGIAITTLLQSSDVAIGFSQILYGAACLPFKSVIPYIFGANIGTCLKAIISTLDDNESAKKVALFHLFFNVTGLLIGMALNLVIDLSNLFSSLSPRMQVAAVHILFNVLAALLVSPFVKKIRNLLDKVLPDKDNHLKDLDSLNAKDIPLVSFGMTIGYRELKELIDKVRENAEMTRNYVILRSGEEELAKIRKSKKTIRHLDHSLQRFLAALPGSKMSDQASAAQTFYLATARNLERITDLNCNVAEYVNMANSEEDELPFSPAAIKEIENMYRMFFLTYEKAFKFQETAQIKYYKETIELEDRTDSMENTYRRNHIVRARKNECGSIVGSSVYSDILSCLERMNDHCAIIAHNSLNRIEKEK